ncbi:MAG: O-antigen ligase family protein [Candidatus Aureabacteria bacterium]|nr:O-antigen ligase family protein [Candidatus Auribacterota bacterium]
MKIKRFNFILILSVLILIPLEKGLQNFDLLYLYFSFSFAAFLLTMIFLRNSIRSLPVSLFSFLLIYLLIVLSKLFSIDPNITNIASLQVLSVLMIFFVLCFGIEKEEKIVLLKILLIYGAFLALIGIKQTLTGTGNYQLSSNLARAHSAFVTPNTFSGYCAVLLITTLYFYFDSSKNKRSLFYLTLIIIYSMAIFCSFSRSVPLILLVLLAPVIIIICNYFICKKKISFINSNKKKLLILISSILILIISFFAYSFIAQKDYTQKRLISLTAPQSASSVGARALYWKSASYIISDFSPFGCGYNSFATAYPWYKSKYFKKDITHFYAHNDYIQFYAEMGIIGLVLLVIFWGGVWLKVRKERGLNLFLGISLIFLSLFSLLEYVFYIPSFMFISVLFMSIINNEGKKKGLKFIPIIITVFIILNSLYGAYFLCKLSIAEKNVNDVKMILSIEGKLPNDPEIWRQALSKMEYAEKMMKNNIAYKMNSFYILGNLYFLDKKTDYTNKILMKFDSIISISKYNLRSIEMAYNFFDLHKDKNKLFGDYKKKAKNILDKRKL